MKSYNQEFTNSSNTGKSFVRKSLSFLGMMLLILSFTAFTSCSREDDPADNDFFAGTYRGTLTFVDGDTDINKDNGSVFVTKIGSDTKYNFRFSDGIPDLNGIEFEKEGDNVMVSVGSSATSYIRIDKNELKILYNTNGKTWTANATR